MSIPELSTPQEVAKALRCSADHIKELCDKGELGASKVAGRWVIKADDVLEYLDRCRNDTKAQPSSAGQTGSGSSNLRTPTDDGDSVERLLRTAEKLKTRSRDSGSKPHGKNVVPLTPAK